MNKREAELLVEYTSEMARETSFNRREIVHSLEEGEESRSLQTDRFEKQMEVLEGLSIIPAKCDNHEAEMMFDAVREEYYCPVCER